MVGVVAGATDTVNGEKGGTAAPREGTDATIAPVGGWLSVSSEWASGELPMWCEPGSTSEGGAVDTVEEDGEVEVVVVEVEGVVEGVMVAVEEG